MSIDSSTTMITNTGTTTINLVQPCILHGAFTINRKPTEYYEITPAPTTRYMGGYSFTSDRINRSTSTYVFTFKNNGTLSSGDYIKDILSLIPPPFANVTEARDGIRLSKLVNNDIMVVMTPTGTAPLTCLFRTENLESVPALVSTTGGENTTPSTRLQHDSVCILKNVTTDSLTIQFKLTSGAPGATPTEGLIFIYVN